MNRRAYRGSQSQALLAAALLLGHLLGLGGAPRALAYALNYTVADMRQPVSVSGGTACPQPNRFPASAAPLNRRWSISLGTTPITILTLDQTAGGRLSEIENAILQSFSVWTSVSGSALRGTSLAPLARTSAQTACSARDGLNSICFDQSDAAFAPGVLAFTRVITADIIGEQLAPGTAPSSFIGQILDADILVRPGDADSTFATPQALPSQPSAYDLESVLMHELGHFFGSGHSGVWSAMMYPFVPPRGEFLSDRPSTQQPDAPLADDDRTALRVLYPAPADAANIGSIRGRVLPANPLSLPAARADVSGVFGAQIVAVDAATGAVIAATIAGWSCGDPGPAQFDGSFHLDRLPVGAGRSYKIYAEPLDGPVDASEIQSSIVGLCRNGQTDGGWPALFACTVPDVMTNFTTRFQPGN
jgi:hypothetical protein